MPEVIAHQPLDALLRLRAGIPEHVGGLLLELVAEHVLVAARFEMQDRTHAQEEVLGVFESAGVGRPAPQQQRIGERRDGARRHHVAQRTRRLLHVGLELIQRRVELRMALRDQLQQRPHDVGMRRRPVKHRPEPVEQLRGAGDKTRIEQRQQELRVVGLEVGELVQLPHLVADDDAEVPERVEKASKEALLRRPDPATEQHQQVDVGMKTEVAPAVAAERDDGYWPLRRACVRIELPQQRVDAIRMAFERRAAARPARDVRAQLVPRRVESRPGGGAALAPGCVIDMGRTSPGSAGGVITGMATTAIIVGIPADCNRVCGWRGNRVLRVRPQDSPGLLWHCHSRLLEGEAETDRPDHRRTADPADHHQSCYTS